MIGLPRGDLTSEEIRDGAVQLTKLLRVGEYTDPAGRRQKVNGDMTKVRQCKGLAPAAAKLISAVEHTSSRVDGDA